ncbi:MAG: T9SS type A sorting domain-containing protein, partial [Nonlabens sp.]|nr:T9SS type A sorting domain-containing protein [Nonlabens sp.]
MMKIKLLTIISLFSATLLKSQVYQGAHTFGTAATDLSQTTAIDAQGNIYVAGNVGATTTFGTSTLTYRGGNADGFLAKYDPNGNPLWIKPFASGFDDVVTAITIPTSGDIFLTGYFQGAGSQSFDADPGPNVFTLSQSSAILSRDCFIIKLNSNGDFVWAKQVSNPSGGAAQEDSFTIAVGEQGSVYVAGRFIFADFDPGAGTQTIITPTGGFEGFILKLDANGNYEWVNHLKNAQNAVRSMLIETNGDVVIVGEFAGTIDVSGATAGAINLTSSGGNDIFMVKYDMNGNHIWSQKIGGTAADAVKVIKKAANGNYLIGGTFNGTININPDTGAVLNVASLGGADGFVLEISTGGGYVNNYIVGGPSADEVYDIETSYAGKTIVTGSYSNTVDFDTSANTAVATSLGSTDSFILSLDTRTLLYDSHLTYGGPGNSKNTSVEYNITLDRLSFLGGFSSNVDFDPFTPMDIKSSNGFDDVYLMQLMGNVLSNETVEGTNEISLFPNPASNFLNLRAISSINKLNVMDAMGRVISTVVFTGNSNEHQVDISNLSSGIYFATIS